MCSLCLANAVIYAMHPPSKRPRSSNSWYRHIHSALSVLTFVSLSPMHAPTAAFIYSPSQRTVIWVTNYWPWQLTQQFPCSVLPWMPHRPSEMFAPSCSMNTSYWRTHHFNMTLGKAAGSPSKPCVACTRIDFSRSNKQLKAATQSIFGNIRVPWKSMKGGGGCMVLDTNRVLFPGFKNRTWEGMRIGKGSHLI